MILIIIKKVIVLINSFKFFIIAIYQNFMKAHKA